MSFTDQRLFRSRALEPIVQLGDCLFLLDQSGPVQKGPFFMVAGIEPIFGIAPHNLLLIYNNGGVNAAPAGYGLAPNLTTTIAEVASGNIAAGASVKIANPKILQGAKSQLVQMRFALKTLALTGPKEHDIEMQTFLPSSVGKFGLLTAGGYLNMSDQFQDPADVIDSPAQNANQTLPAAFPAMHQRDLANLTEIFVWEINGPTFVIYNNGSASLTAGAIGLRIWGFRYDLVPLAPDPSWTTQWVYGPRKAPNTGRPIPVVQTATYTQQGTY